jgi:hypothetical protein
MVNAAIIGRVRVNFSLTNFAVVVYNIQLVM